MTSARKGRQPYWTHGARTKWHTYFTPADDRPGVLLFGLIAALGAVALVVAARHILNAEALVRRDGVLLAIGLAAFVLGSVQGYRLWRER
jgi:hypothetical protein